MKVRINGYRVDLNKMSIASLKLLRKNTEDRLIRAQEDLAKIDDHIGHRAYSTPLV